MKEDVLAVRGVGGYRQYRIPAMAVTPSGKVIAIYDARADFDDLPGPVDLVIRTSDDNGDTWSTQRIFRKHEGISGFGDASIIVDPSFGNKGRVIVLYQWTQTAGFFESIVGTDLDNSLIAHIGRSISDDDGITWRHDVITHQLKDEQTPGIFATSGMGGRISVGRYAGRLLQTFVLRRKTGLLSAIGFSDDHGENWQLGALIPGGNETAIVGLQDGSILLHSRATPFRIAGRSIDGGKTLSELGPDTALPDPSDNGSLLVLKNGDVVCSHNHDTNLRTNTVIKRSTDNGLNWSSAVTIEKGSSAYSTTCELIDGSIGVLFERNAYQEIVFMKISLDEFSAIQNAIEIPSHEFHVEFAVVQRFIRPSRNRELEKQLSDVPTVPNVDMESFQITERKEVGTAGGTTSGDSLFTSEELDLILGPISSGLHTGDEVRFSARIHNHRIDALYDLRVFDRDRNIVFQAKELKPHEKICMLDIRQEVLAADVAIGQANFEFKLIGQFLNENTDEISEFQKIVSIKMPVN